MVSCSGGVLVVFCSSVLLFFCSSVLLFFLWMSVVRSTFGTLSDGRVVHAFTLSRGSLTATVVEFGATLISLQAPNQHNLAEEITLCHRNLHDLQFKHPQCYYGATIGRVGNRIANGTFTLDATQYHCPTNNGPNCLHGGDVGFDKCVWSGQILDDRAAAVTFSLASPDGEQGFPGMVEAAVTYSLSADNTLRLEYRATTTKPTPLALTNHTYWNLSGNCATNVLEHTVTMPSSEYLPVDATSIPTEIATVANTPFDFRTPHTLGERIQHIEGGDPGGYDHCYVIAAATSSSNSSESSNGEDELREVATVECPSSGRTMNVRSDQPGVQLYTGNYLDGDAPHVKHGAFCLETQAFPDAINQWPNQVVLRPMNVWSSTTVHTFGVV